MNYFFMRTTILAVAIVFLSAIRSNAEPILNIIPKPTRIQTTSGYFKLSKSTSVSYNNAQSKNIANWFMDELKAFTSLSPGIKSASANRLVFVLADTFSIAGKEAYRIDISKSSITIIASNPAGLFYGAQSLLQLCGTQKTNQVSIACANIEDQPRFAWRGMHLDDSRHFRGKDFVKKYIDLMAMLKLNVFHWHLTDDQGWRIEIKKYPRLSTVGAWREDRRGENWVLSDEQRPPLKEKKPPYGGFYKQEEIKEIVQYAQDRFVTIVPEIEMPGHSQAALVAYPEYSCFGRAKHVPVGLYTAENWNFSDPYCAGNDQTFTFLEDVLTEVMGLFPSTYIHIGGDECRKVRWHECPKCQHRMRTEGFQQIEELQSYFIKRIQRFIQSKGRKMVGWQEILEGGLAPDATVMPWRDSDALEACLASAQKGHHVVMAASSHLYFELNRTSLSKVYSYKPIPEGLPADKQPYILGVNACSWGEYTIYPKDVEEQVAPNICALAEVAWTPNNLKDWQDFNARMKAMYARLKAMDINYYLPAPLPMPGKTVFTDFKNVSITTPNPPLIIRYSTDGKMPTANSPIYKSPFRIKTTTTITAAIFDENNQSSKPVTSVFEKQALMRPVAAGKTESGLKYKYYSQSFFSVFDIDASTLAESGITDTIGALKKNGKAHGAQMLHGYIRIPANGIFTFSIISNDGSALWIANRIVINHDGYPSAFDWQGTPIFKTGEVALSKGLHPIKINYMDLGANEYLKLYVEGPGLPRQVVTKDFLAYPISQ